MNVRFLLTPWIGGESLDETLRTERLPTARVVEITNKLANALAHFQSIS